MLSSVVLLSSCKDENSVTPATPTDGAVPLSIADASMTASMLRSVTPLTSGSIGVFRGSLNYDAMNNVKYTYATSWGADPTAITLSKSAANICAYYPYDAALNLTSSTLTSAPYTAAKDISYVINQTASSTAATLSFTMIRAYSKITFAIAKATTYPMLGNITSMTIANTGLKTSNTLDISTGTVGSTAATGTYTDALTLASLSTTAANKEYLMVPCTLTGVTTLSFTVDGNTLSGSIANATLSALLAGSNHTVTVTVTGSALIISSVSTTDWATGASTTVTL